MDPNLGVLASGAIKTSTNDYFTFLVDIDAGSSGSLREIYGSMDKIVSDFAVIDLGSS